MKHSLTTWQLIKTMASSVKHLIPHILIAVFFAVLGFLVTLIIPSLLVYLTWQTLVGEVVNWGYLLVLIGLALLRGLCRYGEHYFGHYVAFRTLADFRKAVFAKLVRLAPAKLDGQDSGHLLKMIGEDIEAMEVFFAHTLPPVLTASLTTTLLMLYYTRFSSLIAILALLTYLGLAILLPKQFANKLQPLLLAQTEQRRRYISRFSDSLRGMKELLQFGLISQKLEELDTESQLVNHKEQEVTMANYSQTTATFLLVGLSIIAVSTVAFQTYQIGNLTLLEMTTLIIVFSTSFAPYLELSRLPLGFKRAINAANQVYSLLEEKEVQDSENSLISKIEYISLEEVSFSYDTRSQTIFDNLTQSFEKNKLIGLVGESGSGKSTLMKLIMRWYDITKGQILLNDNPASELSRSSIQSKIAYIPQKPQLFSQTLRENLILGKTNITDDTILETAEKCQIKERILALPEGLDTILSSEKTLFSAGEKQRLELTRALLKNADCYIFDEPTSHLDSLNEAAFLRIIRQSCQGYIFLISHRDSTVSCADQLFKVANKQLIQIK